MKNLLFLSCLLSFTLTSGAQRPVNKNSLEIYEDIKKLNFLGSVMYVAAHPDDENTRMISYLSNKLKAHTTYLSLTRGDGGQNLIGTELRQHLGLLRTQELLAARRIDGGHQFFTRANDFGYSKHSDETLNVWNTEDIKADVTWAIRKHQPDVIINRFDHRTPGRTHGHHTASAVLSHEVFDSTGQAAFFSDQLKHVEPWQARRLFMNTSWWFYGSRENFEKADKSKMLTVDIGTYYPHLGYSNNEIASQSRSQHRCQGMGATWRRGKQLEYLELLKGSMPYDDHDIFEGINTTWSRLDGGEQIGNIIEHIVDNYDINDPAKSVRHLLKARSLISNLDEGFWKQVKLKEIDQIIVSSLGLHLEATAEAYSACRGDSLLINTEVVQRLGAPINVLIDEIAILADGAELTQKEGDTLEYNVGKTSQFNIKIPSDTRYTNPYWLEKEGSLGMYHVENQEQIGQPESTPPLIANFSLQIKDYQLQIQRPILYKNTDSVKGERYRPLEIVPDVSVRLLDDVKIFGNSESQYVQVELESQKDSIAGVLKLNVTDGWKYSPQTVDFSISQKGEKQLIEFEITPPTEDKSSMLSVEAKVNDQILNKSVDRIEYDHIPNQVLLTPSNGRLIKVDIKKTANRLGYIMGAGDKVPESLRQVGYEVTELDLNDITAENLAIYDAVITGIRAYNVKEEIKFKQKELLKYVENGGTLLVQYNTRHRLKTEELGPFPITLSRDRVAVENAEVRLINPDHPIMNSPNKITEADFDNWVQERGLYFPSEWDANYTTLISSNDPGEDPKDGSILIADYGKGKYIYTGISWFRQLPARVPGAYRIFANLISYGTPETNE